jgi:hypothetical protein
MGGFRHVNGKALEKGTRYSIQGVRAHLQQLRCLERDFGGGVSSKHRREIKGESEWHLP